VLRDSSKFLAALVLFFLAGGLCHAQPSTPLASVAQVNALTNAEAALALPVRFEATVTFAEPQDSTLFVASDHHGVYVNFAQDIGLLPGDQVVISGKTNASFRPEIEANAVHFLKHGPVPAPEPAQFKDLIQARFDSHLVRISGHVLAAAMDQETPNPGMRIQIQMTQGTVEARVGHPGFLKAADLLDNDIELTGVAGGAFDSRMQMAGVWIDVYSASDVKVLHRPSTSPWDLPVIPMDQVISAYRSNNESQRVKIAGTLTYYEPGALVVIERDGLAILVETNSTLPIHSGTQVEATGYPDIVNNNVRLDHGELRPLEAAGPAQAQTVNWAAAAAGKYAYNLVAMEGEVVAEIHDSRVDLFIIHAQGGLFSATMRHDSSDALSGSSPAMPAVGSHVRVAGICFVDSGNHWRDRLWFDLRMRSLDDIALLEPPSWWTVKRLAYITTAMSLVILIAVIWAGLLDRRLRAQTAVLARQSQEDAIRERGLARLEQQRSHILELISSSEPLPEVLREIQSTVSSRLFGSACWFELGPAAGGTAELKRPDDPAVVHRELYARDGTLLGLLLATPERLTAGNPEIVSALTAGARLAELAIETRRLYSDLRHRSEHDLLTDIPNRFSMEKHLDRLMQKAMRNEGIFGLIYVDLDKFKQINDRYGHRTGDLYLQEVTRRMKLQLRTDDVLARIGGDEFIALVPILRSRADAEEIAMRLEHCFDEPFELEGYTLLGSASVGLAVYPEDAGSKEGLQRAADIAMYANKEFRKRQENMANAI
jgi:diguanylate cyclase (GGDEF)-like protein